MSAWKILNYDENPQTIKWTQNKHILIILFNAWQSSNYVHVP